MNFKQEREQLNLTAREVAKEASIPLRRYLHFEAGTIKLSDNERLSIEIVLNRAKKQTLAKLEHWNRLNESK